MKKFLILFLLAGLSVAQVRPPDEKLSYSDAASVNTILQQASQAVTGSGTANLLTYWTGTKTIGALATATYPSLAELARVKGVTSPIQTQLNSKQTTLISGTNLKTINGQSLLGSGNIIITSTADTTGQYAKIYAIVQSVIAAQSQSLIGSKATVDSMIVDFWKNNFLRLNK